MTNGSSMKVESIAECSAWNILQYFWPALSDNSSWKSIFEDGRFRDRFYCILVQSFCLIWFFTSNQQSSSYVGMGIPGLNQY